MSKTSENKPEGCFLPLVEEFYTIQGEGFHTGKAAYFIRLGGCDIGCSWCDSPFSWNKNIHPLISADEIVARVLNSGADSVVVTGGEPLMWDLNYLCSSLKRHNICTFLETSGAYKLSGEWDWICLSPKKNMPPVDDICNLADELKVIIELKTDFEWAEKYRKLVRSKCHLFLQPEWKSFEKVMPEVISYVKDKHYWRISIQAHKYMHIP